MLPVWSEVKNAVQIQVQSPKTQHRDGWRGLPRSCLLISELSLFHHAWSRGWASGEKPKASMGNQLMPLSCQ